MLASLSRNRVLDVDDIEAYAKLVDPRPLIFEGVRQRRHDPRGRNGSTQEDRRWRKLDRRLASICAQRCV